MTPQQEIQHQEDIIAKAIATKESLEAKIKGERGNEFVFKPKEGQRYGSLMFDGSKTSAIEHTAYAIPDSLRFGPKYAAMIAEALNIWMDLASSKGVVVHERGVSQGIIILSLDHVKADYYGSMQAGFLSPLFDTQENAQAAIDRVGEDKIKKMFELWHFRG